jgi:hypothetical protein
MSLFTKYRKRKFFMEHDEDYCYPLTSVLQTMKEYEHEEVVVILAEREKNADAFFCKFHDECGYRGEGCGKECEGYSPRNGISGICNHYGYCYEPTEQRFILKSTGELCVCDNGTQVRNVPTQNLIETMNLKLT